LRLKPRKDVLQEALLQQGKIQEHVATEGRKKRASRRSLASRKTQKHVAIEGMKQRDLGRSLAAKKNTGTLCDWRHEKRASRRSLAIRINAEYAAIEGKTLSRNKEKHRNALRLKAGKNLLQGALLHQGKYRNALRLKAYKMRFKTLSCNKDKRRIRYDWRPEKATRSCNKEKHGNTLRLKAGKEVLQEALLQQGKHRNTLGQKAGKHVLQEALLQTCFKTLCCNKENTGIRCDWRQEKRASRRGWQRQSWAK